MLVLLNQQEKQCSQDMERLEKQWSQDIERLEKQHWEDLNQEKCFSKLLEKCSRESDHNNSNSFSQDSVIISIREFRYGPKKEVTFAAYFQRHRLFLKKTHMVRKEKSLTIA